MFKAMKRSLTKILRSRSERVKKPLPLMITDIGCSDSQLHDPVVANPDNAAQAEETTLLDMPDELLLKIFSYLPEHVDVDAVARVSQRLYYLSDDLGSVARVSRHFYSLANDYSNNRYTLTHSNTVSPARGQTLKLLTMVAIRQKEIVCAMIKAMPQLLFRKGRLIDPSRRLFDGIFPIQYLVWAGDTYDVNTILKLKYSDGTPILSVADCKLQIEKLLSCQNIPKSIDVDAVFSEIRASNNYNQQWDTDIDELKSQIEAYLLEAPNHNLFDATPFIMALELACERYPVNRKFWNCVIAEMQLTLPTYALHTILDQKTVHFTETKLNRENAFSLTEKRPYEEEGSFYVAGHVTGTIVDKNGFYRTTYDFADCSPNYCKISGALVPSFDRIPIGSQRKHTMFSPQTEWTEELAQLQLKGMKKLFEARNQQRNDLFKRLGIDMDEYVSENASNSSENSQVSASSCG